MFKSINWKAKIWVISIFLGLIVFIPLMLLLPNGSTNPADPGFWQAFFMAFIADIPVTYYIVKWRQKYLDEQKEEQRG